MCNYTIAPRAPQHPYEALICACRPAGVVELKHDDAIPSRPSLAGKQGQQRGKERLGDAVRDIPEHLAGDRLDEGGDVQAPRALKPVDVAGHGDGALLDAPMPLVEVRGAIKAAGSAAANRASTSERSVGWLALTASRESAPARRIVPAMAALVATASRAPHREQLIRGGVPPPFMGQLRFARSARRGSYAFPSPAFGKPTQTHVAERADVLR